jgi:hypothetical protein
MMISPGLYYNSVFEVEALIRTLDVVEVSTESRAIRVGKNKCAILFDPDAQASRSFSLTNCTNLKSVSFLSKRNTSRPQYDILYKMANTDRADKILIPFWTGYNVLLNGYGSDVYVYFEVFNAEEFVLRLEYENLHFYLPGYKDIPFIQRINEVECILYWKTVTRELLEHVRCPINKNVELSKKILYNYELPYPAFVSRK